NFCALDESVLIPLLKRDDLLMEEIEIWEHLTEWGIAQNLSLNNKNISKWTLEDFDLLKVTLQHCIPLIRYFNIDSADYYDKVRPFEKILPVELKEDILQYYMKRSDSMLLSTISSVVDVNEVDKAGGVIEMDSSIVSFK
ncbi:10857_t:CDS:2, partial [Entrophospora sp. SA101]